MECYCAHNENSAHTTWSEMHVTDHPQAKRSFFLVFIVFLMNAFLAVTAVSSVLALADDLVVKSAMDSQYFSIRGQVALLDIVLLMVAIVSLILVPQLPKLVLLPLVLVSVWQLLGAPGVEWSILDRASQVKLERLLAPVTKRVATAKGTENLAAKVLRGAGSTSSAARW